MTKMSTEAIRHVVKLSDGWTILTASDCEKFGVPQEMIERLAKRHESHPDSIGGGIDVGGVPVPYFDGVRCLDLLYAIADEIEADQSGVIASGRGTRAEQLKKAILARLDELEAADLETAEV